MTKAAGFLLLLTGVAAFALAGDPVAPEIDPASTGAAIAILAGAVLVVRGRRKV